MRDTIRTVVVAIGLALASASAARAQLSPGPLARPHAHLEGMRNCTHCHEVGQGLSANLCLRCHEPLRTRIEAGKGFHGRLPAAERARCERCHHEHVGRDFALVRWPAGGPESFDHRKTGWALEGAHRPLACNKCHNAERIEDAKVRAFKGKAGALARTYLGLDRACASCHEDVHRGELGDDCARCHDQKRFRPARGFDHARTDFPLRGKHADVECRACHLPADARPQPGGSEVALMRWRDLPHSRCTDCHEDRHAGRMGSDCTRCHDERAFKPARYTVAEHAKTGFALRGKHAELGCADCHGERLDRSVQGAACASCHEDRAHGGSLGSDCAACHDDRRPWKDSRFVRARHAPDRFPLTGAHRQAACNLCHLDLVRGGEAEAVRAHPKLAHGKAPAFSVKRPARAIAAHTRASEPPAQCAACHRDRHEGRLGSDCARCHDTATWAPAKRFTVADHRRTRYALEGAHRRVACTKCHGKAEGGRLERVAPLAFARCLDCHEDAHHGELRHRSDRGECAACHTVQHFRPSTFDRAAHDQLAFRLTGAHATVACDRCHREGRERLTLRPASAHCGDCHSDPHAGQLGMRCTRCHDDRDWKPRGFDHARTRFPLRGRHAQLTCAKCHRAVAVGAGRRRVHYRPLETRCTGCHRDPHLGQFVAAAPRRDCTACHDEHRFRPAVRFDHARMTNFPLDGAHAKARCEGCHDRIEIAPGTTVVRYRATPHTCAACHADAHRAAPWRRRGRNGR
ncbi:MAG: hypothetical protein D6776_06375 [Planctomycetota bacterium]|nr:MAG: hypothetical protein D6776_06375 [Planctomycetota bacterium]